MIRECWKKGEKWIEKKDQVVKQWKLSKWVEKLAVTIEYSSELQLRAYNGLISEYIIKSTEIQKVTNQDYSLEFTGDNNYDIKKEVKLGQLIFLDSEAQAVLYHLPVL